MKKIFVVTVGTHVVSYSNDEAEALAAAKGFGEMAADEVRCWTLFPVANTDDDEAAAA
jgi:hypothetical protein